MIGGGSERVTSGYCGAGLGTALALARRFVGRREETVRPLRRFFAVFAVLRCRDVIFGAELCRDSVFSEDSFDSRSCSSAKSSIRNRPEREIQQRSPTISLIPLPPECYGSFGRDGLRGGSGSSRRDSPAAAARRRASSTPRRRFRRRAQSPARTSPRTRDPSDSPAGPG